MPDLRLQFPLYKCFLVLAAYAAALGVLSQLGRPGIILALVVGTAASALILAIQTKNDLLSMFLAGAGGLIGGFFGLLFCPPVVNRYTIADAVRDGVILTIATIAGAVLFSWASKR